MLRVSARNGVWLCGVPDNARGGCRPAAPHGIAVMMGAPNLIRGGSHSGNVAARELAEAGLLDIMSSDYVPAGLAGGALLLGDIWGDLGARHRDSHTAPRRARRA